MKYRHILALLFLVCRFVNVSAHETINPSAYGILEAKTGVDRYRCLLACHQDAIKKNVSISYAGINKLDIEIPSDAVSIPLPNEVDFAGIQLNVVNNQKSIFLFVSDEPTYSILVSQKSIDTGRFSDNHVLSSGSFLLILNDEKPWVENRKGYNYGATRRDVLVVSNGVAQNSVTYPYCNGNSIPKAAYAKIGARKMYKNLVFNRSVSSSKMTNLISVRNSYGVSLSCITLNTPQDNSLYGDAAIQIKNSADVKMKDITINGTYSQTGQYGYGINLDNVTMFTGECIYARARWGVFGTYNVNGTTLIDCDINRFDIHCYGKDVRCYNCHFSDLYNQFSSVFGDVYFEKCTFTNFTPVLIESSYNAYTPFDLTFKECTFNLSDKNNRILTLMSLEKAHSPRPELSRKALPNIIIRNCTVNLAEDVKNWYIINTGKVTYKESLDYISKIEVNRLKINGNVDYKLFSTDLKTTNPLRVVRKRVKLISRS